MMRIPKEVEIQVVTKLYSDAAALDWDSLTLQQHSQQYSRWVDEPDVGGRLREYLSGSDARVWIKDGPMKERTRALNGVGKYANLVKGADIPTELVRRALGDNWHIDRETLKIKPLRVTARDHHEKETVVTWGPGVGLKHLVWAALTASAEGDPRDWVLCVVEPFINPTPANERQAQMRIANRCELRLVHITL
jgi:hypothetical protein